MNPTATYSPEDNKLRMYPFSRLDKETYERVNAAGFKWAPKQELFVAPMWTPYREDLMIQLCGEIGDEDTSLVERQEQRAERFEEYSDNRREDADRAHKAVNAITEHIPLGQPVLVGHHSEKHARRDAEKIDNGMRKAVKMWEQSEYWKRRAAGALAHAKYKELPGVRHRRIKGLMSDLRREEKRKQDNQDFLTNWNHSKMTMEVAIGIANYDHVSKCFPVAEYPRREGASKYEGEMSLYSALRDEIITPEQAREIAVRVHARGLASAERWIGHINNRIEYEKAMLAEQGGTAADKFEVKAGGRVLVEGEWLVVIRVNKSAGAVNSVTTTPPRVVHWQTTWKYGIEKIRDYRPPTEGDAEKVAVATKLPLLCNYPGEGFHHVCKATWDKKYKDYKWTTVVEGTDQVGKHRVRAGMFVGGGQRSNVFVTDLKRVDPPPPTGKTGPVRFERKFEDSALQVRTVQPKSEDELKFEALKRQAEKGVKIVVAPQLFPTPPELAERMVDAAGIEPGHDVLEPSAGTGIICEAILKAEPGAKLFAVEINHSLCELLSNKLTPPGEDTCKNVLQGDFLECNGNLGKFDRVVMNPPFANAVDIEHIEHALRMLKPNGRLVAICANGPRQNKKLKPLVERLGGEWEVLPPDTFKNSGTGVNTVMLTVDAPSYPDPEYDMNRAMRINEEREKEDDECNPTNTSNTLPSE